MLVSIFSVHWLGNDIISGTKSNKWSEVREFRQQWGANTVYPDNLYCVVVSMKGQEKCRLGGTEIREYSDMAGYVGYTVETRSKSIKAKIN